MRESIESGTRGPTPANAWATRNAHARHAPLRPPRSLRWAATASWLLLLGRAASAQDDASLPDSQSEPPRGQPTTAGATPSQLAQASTPAEACVLAHERAIAQLDEAQLLEADESLRACIKPACPAIVRDECAAERHALKERLPTVVLVAKDAGGDDLTNVRVTVNGEPLLDSLGSQAVRMNPGEYEFAFLGPDGQRGQREVVLREGELRRRVQVEFGQLARTGEVALEAPRTSRWTTPFVVSAAASAAGLASFAYFGLSGIHTERCAPQCTETELSTLRRQYLAADISLGVGVAGAAAATLFWLYPPGHGPSWSSALLLTPERAAMTTAIQF